MTTRFLFSISCFSLALNVAIASAQSTTNHQIEQTPPIKLGTSGSSANDASLLFCCAGTIGSAVLYDGALHILSNNHVLARSGRARVAEKTIQPGLVDNNCSAAANVVGHFIGDVVPLGTANVDAGLSLARAGMVDETGAILDIGVPCTEIQTPTIGLPVIKSGRTTGTTTDNITTIDLTVSVRYRKGCGSGRRFVENYSNQIATGVMAAAGDSGSLLLSNDGAPKPVGLLYAGSSTMVVFNPIQDVVDAFSNGRHTFSFVGIQCDTLTTAKFATPATAELEKVQRLKAKHERALFMHPGVLGVGVGAAENNPLQPAIVIYLETPDGGPMPHDLPADINGTELRVIFTDSIEAL
ncbi:MAG: hypothetical protein HY287_07455 [Planctomycetes bacterium]|nr:hypothetical protein [Planctomycetota bacterium]MBI3834149.1 hypothetical protein [Planctomycetota bacterium]